MGLLIWQRQAAQCVGRVIRSKADYGMMIFADKRYDFSMLGSWMGSLVCIHVSLTFASFHSLFVDFVKLLGGSVFGRVS